MSVRLPAFRDGHAHPIFAGREALGPQLDGLRSIELILDTVSKFAKGNPDTEWIVGGAYERSLADTFLASWLDSVVPDRPVVLHASDHHTIWVNSEALRRAGVIDKFPEVFPGFADIDSTGRPTGTLRESGAMDVVLSCIPPLSLDAELSALTWSQERMLENGIVQVQDAWIERGMAEIYLEALRRNQLKVATNLAFRVTPENYQSDLEYFLDLRSQIQDANSPLLTAKTAKFFADGVLGSGTAAVIEPYADTHSHGEPVWEFEQLREAANRYAEHGFQLHIHAIGDAAVRDSLSVIEGAPKAPLPAVIAHAELISDADISRFATLGVIANMQPLWARPDGMLLSCRPRIGDRIERMYKMRSLLAAGANISFGSDWPVSSVSPLEGIQTAVTRSFEGQVNNPDEAITVDQALFAYTHAVGKQLGAEDQNETIVLSADPRNVDPHEISSIQVLEVARGAEVLYRAT